RHVENATADMRLKPHHGQVGFARMAHKLLQLGDRHTELRVGAGGTDVMMVTPANAGVDANENLTIAENIRPRRHDVSVVYGDSHSLFERPLVLAARREVRRIENAGPIDLGEKLDRAFDLTT